MPNFREHTEYYGLFLQHRGGYRIFVALVRDGRKMSVPPVRDGHRISLAPGRDGHRISVAPVRNGCRISEALVRECNRISVAPITFQVLSARIAEFLHVLLHSVKIDMKTLSKPILENHKICLKALNLNLIS